MQQRTIFALALSLLVHVIVLFLISSVPKGLGVTDKQTTQLQATLVYLAGPKPVLYSSQQSKSAPPTIDLSNEIRLPATVVTPLSPTNQKPMVSDNAVSVKNQPSAAVDSLQMQDSYGLEGKANIIYWPFDQVDQAALMLAEWPEGLSTNAWPPDQPVSLELWINPDGALADIAFSQKDLPDSLRIMLIETISRAGFKPAIRNGERVGNHRMLEVLLSQISVPPLVTY